MSLYVFGNLFGRLVVSYLLVWVVLLLIAKFDWRKAFRNSRRWYAIVAVLILFLIGIAAFDERGGFG
jgi:hypothetical protein